jgi:uncharacterized iron-regulated protein
MTARAGRIAVFVGLAACGGSYGGHATSTSGSPAGGKRGIEAAGLPYHVLDRTGHQLDEAEFWARVDAARVVCVGEEHQNPHHHWVQLQVVRQVATKWPQLALGMEMFQRPFQGVLDDYAAHRISAGDLRTRAGWEERWGYDWSLYAPILDRAVAAHAVLLALNAPKELTKKVVHHGLESLTPEERAQMPQLDLQVAAHRAWFDTVMEEMGGSEAHSKAPPKDGDAKAAPPSDQDDDAMPSADRIYTVQVIWDETMADTTAKYLAAHPDARVVILAGNGHCHDTAIVGRIQRRGIRDVVSIRVALDDGADAVASAVAKPMNDFLFVLELPPDVKEQHSSTSASSLPPLGELATAR